MTHLITDWETDAVLISPVRFEKNGYQNLPEIEMFYSDFSDALIDREPNFFVTVEPGINHRKASRLLAPGMKFIPFVFPDIWLRDYMPLQTTDNFVKFIYNPRYNSSKINAPVDIAVRSFMEQHFTKPVKYVDLLLDGGNFTHNGKIGVTTTRTLEENRSKSQAEIEKILKDNLLLENIVFIPPEPYEKTGHVDGIFRWISPTTYIVAHYLEDVKYEKKLKKVLNTQLSEYTRIEIPYIPSSSNMDGWYDAAGVYVNYLQTSNAVYVPTFGIEADKYVGIFKEHFNKPVITVNSDGISRGGGVINCVTWNYLTE